MTRPTIALVGERGPEAIVPMHKLSGFGGGGVTVNVSVGGGGDIEAQARQASVETYRAIMRSRRDQQRVKATARRGL